MVHKGSNRALKDMQLLNVGKPNSHGIHKHESTSSWLDEYDSQVEKMHKQLDMEYEKSAKRQEEAQERIRQLQEEEEFERMMEEERLHREQMRQLEVERTKAEIEALKEDIKKAKRPSKIPYVVEEEKKPSFKERLVSAGKKVAGIVGAVTGHPEVSAVATALPEEEPRKVKKVKYKEPEYSPEGEVVYGSWVKR